MARAAMVSKGTTKNYSGPNFTSKNRKGIAETRLPKTPSDGKQNFEINGMGSFRKKLIAEGHSKKAASRFSDSSRKGSINHHDKLEKLE